MTRPIVPPSPWVTLGFTLATFALLIVNVITTDRYPVAFVYTVRVALLVLSAVHGYNAVRHWRRYQALRRLRRAP